VSKATKKQAKEDEKARQAIEGKYWISCGDNQRLCSDITAKRKT
jgi:hypothetical protein